MLIIRMSRLLSPIAAVTQRSSETCALLHVGVGTLEVWHLQGEGQKMYPISKISYRFYSLVYFSIILSRIYNTLGHPENL